LVGGGHRIEQVSDGTQVPGAERHVREAQAGLKTVALEPACDRQVVD